jgi:hypothetical protein
MTPEAAQIFLRISGSPAIRFVLAADDESLRPGLM